MEVYICRSVKKVVKGKAIYLFFVLSLSIIFFEIVLEINALISADAKIE